MWRISRRRAVCAGQVYKNATSVSSLFCCFAASRQRQWCTARPVKTISVMKEVPSIEFEGAQEEKAFEIKPYPKRELARLYFPYLSESGAMHKLNKWIRLCPGLYSQLYSDSESKNDRSFTRRQVRLIVKYLDTP